MCGIAASIGRERSSADLLARVAHRGPDHLGWGSFGEIFLGSARLRITEDARGDMPLHSRSGLVSISANAEIFNHRDLYPGEGSDLRGLADLWEARGPECLPWLRGPFALAVLDRRDGSLTIARDEYGVRPLHYRRDAAGFSVASEHRALVLAGAPTTRDERAWDHLLAFQFLPPGRTAHAEIRSLEPGTWLRIQPAETGYRSLRGEFSCALSAERPPREELARAVALQAAVGRRAAIFLSGGLDSSAVLGLLAAAGAAPALAVVGWFPDGPPEEDERPFARAVAREAGVELVETAITAEDHERNLMRLLAAHGGPEAGPGGPSAWSLAHAAAAAGAQIVFSGQGGDELFGGYERYRQLAQRFEGRTVAAARGYESLLSGAKDPLAAALFRGLEYLPLLEPERRRSVEEAAATLTSGRLRSVDQVMEFEVRTLLPGLLAVDDRALGAYGIEGRVPLLDPVVAAAARRVPFAQKSPAEAPRRLFREWVGPALPHAVRDRKDKMGFPVPLARWFSGPWRGRLSDPRVETALQDLGFNRSALRRGVEALSPRARWFLLAAARSEIGTGASGLSTPSLRTAHAL